MGHLLKNNFGGDSVFVDAEIKVLDVSGGKPSLRILTQISDADGKILKHENEAFVPSVAEGSENFIKQAYVYLKTLDFYAGAADI